MNGAVAKMLQEGGEHMQLSITLKNFPMGLAPRFCDEIAKYAKANIAFSGKGTATVHMDSEDIVKIQEVCIVCDKYSIATDADISDKLEP